MEQERIVTEAEQAFLAKCGLTTPRLEAVGIQISELEEIVESYKSRESSFLRTAQNISNILLQDAGVHSVRYRAKDPYSLAKKVVRKREDDNTRVISKDTYSEELTDLAGVRALHLFKSDWIAIHDFIIQTWETKETPVVYYRKGDSEELLEIFKERGCEIKEHPFGYRSVHYLILTSPTKKPSYVEIQVRTIFEEGWSEVDHKIRYPEFSDNPLITNLLMLLNRSAGAADEMSSFVQGLNTHLRNNSLKFDRLAYEKDKQIKELQDRINNLQISKEEKQELNTLTNSIKQVDKNNPSSSPASFDAYPDWAFVSPAQTLADKILEITRKGSSFENLIRAANSPMLLALSKQVSNTSGILNAANAASAAKFASNSSLDSITKAAKVINIPNNPALGAISKLPKGPKPPNSK